MRLNINTLRDLKSKDFSERFQAYCIAVLYFGNAIKSWRIHVPISVFTEVQATVGNYAVETGYKEKRERE